MRRFLSILFVIVLELYSDMVLFGIGPALAQSFPIWIWLSVVFVLLLVPFFAGCFLLRRENPAVFLCGVPVTAIVIIILARINSEFLVNGLVIYGIYSIYSPERDIVLTYLPYYVDAIIMALLMVAGRYVFFLPFKLYNELLGDEEAAKKEEADAAKKEEPEPQAAKV